MWCACVQHAGNRMKSLSHCARVRWSSAADINASLSEPAKSSWLTCCGDSLEDRKKIQLRLTFGVPLQRHMDERRNKTHSSIPAIVCFHFLPGCSPVLMLMWAWNAPRKLHFHWVTSWMLSPSMLGSHIPPPLLLCGAERLPPAPHPQQ